MKYRAIAIGLMKDGHPVQCFSNDEMSLVHWAITLSQKENVDVQVFVTEERCVKHVLASQFREPVKTPLKKPCNYNHDSLRETSNVETCPDCGESLRV